MPALSIAEGSKVASSTPNGLLYVDADGKLRSTGPSVTTTDVAGYQSATPSAVYLKGQSGLGTDIAGANFYIDGSRPTGAGVGGSVIIRTAAAGASGSTLRSLANTLACKDGKVSIGTTIQRGILTLDLSPTNPGNVAYSQYSFCGTQYSSGSLIFGYNAKAFEGTTGKTVVANTNAVVGYTYIRMGYVDGFEVHSTSGSVTAGATAYSLSMVVSPSKNVGIATSTFGTSATNTFAIATGIAPTSSPASVFQIYSADQVAGNACLHTRTENGAVVKLYQEEAVADSTGSGDVVAQLNSLLARLRAHGLIAT